MAQLSLEAVINKNLFSDHYLENLIGNTAEWKKDDHEEPFKKIKDIYQAELPFLDGLNEPQLEKRFFRRIFQILFPEFEVQATTKTQDFPDYAFFPDQQSLDYAHKNKGNKSFYVNAFAVGEVKRWEVELDKFGKDKHDKKRNPSFQIWLYLQETEPKWGILSNGRKWRLYHQGYPLDRYYEVDLVNLIETDDLEGFRYFYYFFRKEAFLPSESGKVFLDEVLNESIIYAKAVGDNLRENVYRAMKKLSDGFFAWNNELDVYNEQTRLEVQKSTMRLLYRFLFLLYAEGKGLLELKNEMYKENHSFYKLKEEVANRKDGPIQDYYSPASTTIWSSLKDLFRLVNEGSEALGISKDQFHIPAYNGGLFDSKRNPNLEKWSIGDTYLADAIDLLARSDINGGKAFVDYSTLEIRHLGSIYEGLLEYKLKLAEEDLVVKGKKERKWVTLEKFNENRKNKLSFEDFEEFDRVEKGNLYLATDKGERKATGSYYTPDYVVNYIVENTVGPIVQKKWSEALENKTSLLDAVLSVKVLDPAMGSGHFLVGAIEFLAGKLLEAAQNDIEAGLIKDEGYYTPDWAKREVLAHCIYGVDLNDLAVELAKVSLWLTTISKDKPLNFLDHRLKQGNSLIGSKIVDLAWLPGQRPKDVTGHLDKPLGLVGNILEKLKEFEDIPDDTLDKIRKKEELFNQLKESDEYKRVKSLADVHTGLYFEDVDFEKIKDHYMELVNEAYFGDSQKWEKKFHKPWVQAAMKDGELEKFFHWELEFPEVFFDKGDFKKSPGFDVVVGNPPYIRVHKLDYIIKNYLWDFFETYRAKSDILNCFMEKGIKLLRNQGYFGYITSDTWRVLSSALSLRVFLLRECAIKRVTLLPEKVFEDASVKPVVLITEKQQDLNKRNKSPVEIYDLESNNRIAVYAQEDYTEPESYIFHTIPKEHYELRKKIDNVGKKLDNFVDIYFGLKTGDDSLFIKSKVENPEDKKLIASETIKRYYMEWTGYYVWYVPDKMRNHRSTARPGTKERFEQEKIVISRMADRLSATFDDQQYYIKDAYICHTKEGVNPKYILALLNSKLLDYYYKEVFTTVDFHKNEILQLPIRSVNFDTPLDSRNKQVEKLKKLYLHGLENKEYDSVIEFVVDCLNRYELDVVHDFLTYLANQMMDGIKEGRKEIKEFIEWLETIVGVKIGSLSDKNKLAHYYEFDFGEFFDILKKNKNKLAVNVLSKEFHTNLKQGFENSVDKISSLGDKLAFTDELTDQIVYKLYGLSNEEIKIVEENT
ncbi:MAG: Eco57I restriction-modification methylase domain-containing protein [Petrotogales bacterium]